MQNFLVAVNVMAVTVFLHMLITWWNPVRLCYFLETCCFFNPLVQHVMFQKLLPLKMKIVKH